MSNQFFTEVSVEQQEIVSGGNTTERVGRIERTASSRSFSVREDFFFFTTTTTEESASFSLDEAEASSSEIIEDYEFSETAPEARERLI